jgi:hypothetical protein
MIHEIGNRSARVRHEVAGLFFYVLTRNAFIPRCGQTRFRA